MKLLIIRCGICDTWYHASKDHCYYCGASRGMKINNRMLRFQYSQLPKFVEVVRGTPSDLALRAASIANTFGS